MVRSASQNQEREVRKDQRQKAVHLNRLADQRHASRIWTLHELLQILEVRGEARHRSPPQAFQGPILHPRLGIWLRVRLDGQKASCKQQPVLAGLECSCCRCQARRRQPATAELHSEPAVEHHDCSRTKSDQGNAGVSTRSSTSINKQYHQCIVSIIAGNYPAWGHKLPILIAQWSSKYYIKF